MESVTRDRTWRGLVCSFCVSALRQFKRAAILVVWQVAAFQLVDQVDLVQKCRSEVIQPLAAM